MDDEIFDPIRLAGEWHSGQFSPLYSLSSLGRIYDDEIADGLESEIDWLIRSSQFSLESETNKAELELLLEWVKNNR